MEAQTLVEMLPFHWDLKLHWWLSCLRRTLMASQTLPFSHYTQHQQDLLSSIHRHDRKEPVSLEVLAVSSSLQSFVYSVIHSRNFNYQLLCAGHLYCIVRSAKQTVVSHRFRFLPGYPHREPIWRLPSFLPEFLEVKAWGVILFPSSTPSILTHSCFAAEQLPSLLCIH